MSTATQPEIVLDLSRLLSRVLHPTPTGVDRCEMAYARGLLASVPERLSFAAVHPFGIYGRLPRLRVERFLDATEARWEHGDACSTGELRLRAARRLTALCPRSIATGGEGTRVYVQASPNNLTRPQLVRSILRRERARFVCLLHDLIPLQYPEYARPKGAALHLKRVETIIALADGIVANSHATLDALRPFLAHTQRRPVTAVAHLGAERRTVAYRQQSGEPRPYFVCIGTIEPRKNHLLLLNLWRQMAQEHGAAACPRLLVIGRRGWENEQVVDMLERCPALVGCVEELNHLPDREVQALLAGSCALLLPSFAEGYGMPVTEAIALGVPVICSDLPALREAGGDMPTYLNPLDGLAWLAAIRDHAVSGKLADVDGLHRRDGYAAPTWKDHLATLLDLVQRVAP